MQQITVFKPFVSDKAREYVQKVLSGTQLAEGPIVKEFETKFGTRFNFKNVVALNSGTSALELAYELAGVNEGDEVITPVLTCTATNLPILHRKAIPVFADINDGFVIDAKDAEKRITSKTKAIVYVHFGGNSDGLKDIQELAKRHSLKVIEDAAQCVGSKQEWGTSDFVCISLQAIKILTSGDGGFLIVKDDELFQKAKRLRWFGYDRELKQKLGDTDLLEAGYKYHMNDITAAIGLGNLEELDSMLKKREKVRGWYLNECITTYVYHWLILLVHPNVREVERKLEHHLKIKTSPYHYRNDKYTVFGGRRSDLPKMNELENMYTLLPFHHDITEEDVKLISDRVRHTLWNPTK